MKITDIFEELNSYAPVDLSKRYCEQFDCYDNSGILLNTDEDIDSIIFCLDITKEVVNKALKDGFNLIVTHHPVIFIPGSELTNEEYINSLPNDNIIKICKLNNIGIISFHLNLDTCKKGIDYCLARKFGKDKIIQKLSANEGYGRLVQYEGTVEGLYNYVKDNISSKSILYTENKNEKIHLIGTYCGAGLDEGTVNSTKLANVFISSDVKHHIILNILENNQSLIMIDHYESEIIGFKEFYNYFKNKLKIKTEIVLDGRFTDLNN